MSDAPLIVGVSGLRGIVGESLTPEVAVRYAGAFGAWLIEREGTPAHVALGADGRRGWQAVNAAVKAGLLASGCNVIEVGVIPTPTMGEFVDSMGYDAGVVITASHNPQEWNGIKLLVCEWFSDEQRELIRQDQDGSWVNRIDGYVPGSRAPTGAEAEKIIERFHAAEMDWMDSTEAGQEIASRFDFLESHITGISCSSEMTFEEDTFDSIAQMNVVVDSVNCSGWAASARLAAELGYHEIQIAGSQSGIFPHTPEPTAENLSGKGGLCDAVRGLKADIGFAQDPDADRLAIIDENGRYIGEEYTLALCAESVLSAWDEGEGEEAGSPSPRPSPHGGEGGGEPVLVANLSTSRMIDDVAAKHGGRVVRTPVGEANVVEAMKREKVEGANVVLGGEGNGGVIWPEVVYVRDSLGSMALVLGLMVRTGKTVSELVSQIDSYSPGGGAGYTILKRKVDIASKADAQPAVDAVSAAYTGRDDATVDLQDGVRVDFPARGVWVHVRASNTEPIMRLIAEAPTDADAVAILTEVEGVIAG